MMPCSLSTVSCVKYGVETNFKSMRRFSSKPEVQSKKYAVIPLDVNAFG